MNLADTLPFSEAQIYLLFKEVGLTDAPEINVARVDSVLNHAIHECLIKNTACFVFKGFPEVITGMLSVFTGSYVGNTDADYKV